jgi:hypothetical protein
MASSSKRKTTMAKLNRERGLAERRMAKEARKAARKRAAAEGEPMQGLSDLPPDAAFNDYGDTEPSSS